MLLRLSLALLAMGLAMLLICVVVFFDDFLDAWAFFRLIFFPPSPVSPGPGDL